MLIFPKDLVENQKLKVEGVIFSIADEMIDCPSPLENSRELEKSGKTFPLIIINRIANGLIPLKGFR
jgi:hypothetical protein